MMTTREVETLERIATALESIAGSLKVLKAGSEALSRCIFNASADPSNPDKVRPALRVYDWSRD